MRRIYINAPISGVTDPPIGESAARENERNVFARRIKDGQFQIEVKGRGGDRLPHRVSSGILYRYVLLLKQRSQIGL
jgi:hypothetical protein